MGWRIRLLLLVFVIDLVLQQMAIGSCLRSLAFPISIAEMKRRHWQYLL
jgi:hypothetical protein